jgi:CYTH domain-containing protein
MKTETERKFLLRKDLWYAVRKPPGEYIRQGYLFSSPEKSIRIRIAGNLAYLTIKGQPGKISRTEIEFPVPLEEARWALEHFTGRIIEKMRYKTEFHGKTWEVDEFFGENEGLILAEIELSSPDETFDHPAWLGGEVTGDPKYYNACLAEHPYSTWEQ